MTDKYKAACIEYADASKEVKRLTKAIGYQRLRCIEANNNTDQEHLKKAYAFTWVHSGWDMHGERIFVNHDYDDPADYLKETCRHCYQAHELIQQRKAARQGFGVAKRRVVVMGNAGAQP